VTENLTPPLSGSPVIPATGLPGPEPFAVAGTWSPWAAGTQYQHAAPASVVIAPSGDAVVCLASNADAVFDPAKWRVLVPLGDIAAAHANRLAADQSAAAANEAAVSADAARTAADSALAAVNTAAAGVADDQAAVQHSLGLAQNAAQTAGDAAGAASGSAAAADASKTAAGESESAAAGSATAAAGSATGAAASAAAAAGSAAAADVSRTAADASAASAATAGADASRLTIGTVQTTAPGTAASAIINGAAGAQSLNLTLPQGPQGATAVVTAPVFASVSAGVAGVADGALFAVQPSAWASMAADVYARAGGSGVYKFSQPGGGPGMALDTSFSPRSGFLGGIVDSARRAIAAVDLAGWVSGKFVKPGKGLVAIFDTLGFQTMALGTVGGASFDDSASARSGFLGGIFDSWKRVIIGVKTDGSVVGNFVTPGTGLVSNFDPFGRQTLSLSGTTALSTTLACLGDSLTAGAGGSGGYPARLGVLFPTRTILNMGIGGQTSTEIAQRVGAVPPTLSLAGSVMTTGANVVTAINGAAPSNTNGPLSTPSDNTTRPLTGTFCGVHGTLSRSATGGPPSTAETYIFTPDAGVTLPQHCPAGTPFIVDAGGIGADLAIIWLGRNNFSPAAQVMADVAACVAMLTYPKRFIVMGVLNGNYAAETINGSNWLAIVSLNQQLQAAYPANFFDARRYLIDRGLADAGITPTTQDLTDIANDLVPTSLRFDNVHLIQPAYNLIGTQLAAIINTKGW